MEGIGAGWSLTGQSLNSLRTTANHGLRAMVDKHGLGHLQGMEICIWYKGNMPLLGSVNWLVISRSWSRSDPPFEQPGEAVCSHRDGRITLGHKMGPDLMGKGSTGGTVHVQDECYELHWSAAAYTEESLRHRIPAAT